MLKDCLNKIICGDCVQVVSQLPDEPCLDAICIDPPWGESQEYEGDSNITDARHGLRRFLEAVEPKLKRNAYLAVFFTMRNVDICIEEVKRLFTFRRVLTMYLPSGGCRPFLGWLPRTEAIVIGQKYLPKQPSEFHYDMAVYLNHALGVSGLSRNEVARKLGCDSRLVMKWTRVGDPAWCLPTPRFYKPLKELLKLDEQFDILLDREPVGGGNQRNDFEYKHDCYIVDNKNEKMIHPAQKPLSVCEHIITCICPLGGIVLDGFCGSGTTAMAARNTGRNFICCDISEEYCEIARRRLKADCAK